MRNKSVTKTIVFMLNINDLIIKLFLDLYLVGIYDSYIFLFMCEYVYHEPEGKWLCKYIFMFYLFFGIENYCVIMFISHTKF